MLPKVVVMDLGGTVINNLAINFENGLRYIYQNYCLKQVKEEQLILDSLLIRELGYNKRDNDNFEINFHNYLNYIDKTIGFKESLDYDLLEQAFIDYACTDELIEGVVPLLKFFKEHNIDVYILSNSCFSSKALKYELSKQHILSYFIDVFSSADYLMRKPSPLFFNVAFKYLKNKYQDLNESDIMYIGNEYKYDIEGASIFKVKTVWFNQHHNVVENSCADCEIDKYSCLIEMLKKECKNETI